MLPRFLPAFACFPPRLYRSTRPDGAVVFGSRPAAPPIDRAAGRAGLSAPWQPSSPDPPRASRSYRRRRVAKAAPTPTAAGPWPRHPSALYASLPY